MSKEKIKTASRNFSSFGDNNIYLADEGCNPDNVIDGIREESEEDVPLAVDLPGIDFVEESHHNEGVEDHGEMLRWRGVQFRTLAVVQVQ